MNKEIIVKVLLDSVKYNQKPTSKKEITSICKRLNNTNPTEITVEELIKEITYPNGKSFCPATFNGNRKNENWCSQQIFVLDFDGKISLEIVLKRLNEYGLDCSSAYSTFNDTPEHPKFRVIWQFENVISDQVSRKEIQTALMLLFPECDQACKDPSRMYFGGKKVIYENYKYSLDLYLLIDTVKCFKLKDIKSSSISKTLKSLDKKIGKAEKWMKSGNPYIYNIDDSIFNPKNDKNNTTLIKVDFEEVRKKIKILDDFMNGKWLYHMELFGLATNLIHINGGAKLFKQCLDSNPNYSSDKYNLPAIAKFYDYNPMSLEFSPYDEDHRFKNLLEAAKTKQIIRIAPYFTIPMTQARSELNSTLSEILANNDTNIHIIKAATGLGKTHNLLGRPNVLLAFPNHDFKDEVAETMKTEYFLTPSSNELPDEIKQPLDYLYSIGAWERANSYLNDQSNYYLEVAKYREQLLTAYGSDQTVLTTHQKAILRKNWRHQTIIFDEDPFKVLLPISKITFNDLHNLEPDNSSDRQVIRSIIHELTDKPKNTVFSMNLIAFEDYGRLLDKILNSSSKFNSNILGFFDCDYYLISAKDSSIEYIKRETLPENKKVIILSATANEQLYRLMYGDKVKFYDLSNVEPTGTVIQHTAQSCSRTSLNNNLERIARLVHEHKNQKLPTLTFANYKESLRNKGINVYEHNHFGKAVGSNALEGKNINVIGTPHVSSNTIALYAHAIKIPIKASDLIKPNNMTVENNGFRFWFNTYENPHLRNIQFFCIESELRQAIGRSRFNTTEAIVNLYSNYPLPEACLTDEEKTREEFRVNQIKEKNQN